MDYRPQNLNYGRLDGRRQGDSNLSYVNALAYYFGLLNFKEL